MLDLVTAQAPRVDLERVGRLEVVDAVVVDATRNYTTALSRKNLKYLRA